MKDNYYKLHEVCPICKQIPNEQTYMGYINPSDENPDENECKCLCGWIGIVHNLIKRKNEYSRT
jgi:hypothetical protein